MSQHDDSFDLPLLPLDDRPGPARRLPPAQAQAMIRAALDALPAAAPATAMVSRPRRWQMLLMAAAVVAVAGVASAGIYAWTRPGPGMGRGVGAGAEPDTDTDFDSDTEPDADSDSDTEPDVDSDSDTEPDTDSDAAQLAQPTAERPTRSAARRRHAQAPEDLMRLANEQRRARRWRAADALYQRIAREHGRTHPAHVAAIASASIRLEHLRDARGALRLYRSVLRQAPDSALAEEARWGLVEAYHKLGQRDRETRALKDFLARYPASPLHAQASARLRALGALDPGDTP